MCAMYGQNSRYPRDQVPSYYVNNKQYGKGSYARTEWPTRTSRRIHDGFSIDRNYGLDTVSDDVNSSPYSSPFYINGRYNSSNLTAQHGNSASVQGTTRLLTYGDDVQDFSESDIQTTIELWQGKTIRFSIPYTNKVVGNTITLRNTGACTGILSLYFSATVDGPVIAETAIDLCEVSQDNFEHRKLYMNIPVPRDANPRGRLYIRMEIWDEITCERSTDPFNTGRKIEIVASGKYNHELSVMHFGDKNTPVQEAYVYTPAPSAPLIGLIYNPYTSVPCTKNEGLDVGATATFNGYTYHIFCVKDEYSAKVLVYDPNTNTLLPDNQVNIKLDGRITEFNCVQVDDTIQYVDGYSPLQSFKIGTWNSTAFPFSVDNNTEANVDTQTWLDSPLGKESGYYVFHYVNGSWQLNDENVDLATYGITLTGQPVESAEIRVSFVTATETTELTIEATYSDTRPVVGASKIAFHNNRVYLGGFRYDQNLMQCSRITEKGPDFSSFPYRFYVPNRSPRATSTNPITAICEVSSDQLMISFRNGDSLYTSNVNLEDGTPTQVSNWTDGAGVASQGDIVSYRGHVYSFDPDEGLRRWSGAVWNRLSGMAIDTLFERVDMTKPRKLWGYAYKLYFNYTDVIDGRPKCIVHDLTMNYQQFPFFQDSDIPFCDVRPDDDFDLIGIHPDFPCIMRLYDQNVWRRLDTPIDFERHTKYMSIPGNASDLILKRVHNKVIANANRWWYFGLSIDEDSDVQTRGNDIWYRMPCWATVKEKQPVETPFSLTDNYETNGIALLTLPNLRCQGISVQEKIKCRTFRQQANLVSTLFEVGSRQYL